MDKLTLGSLFDGSGGFPLAGLMHGVTPVWASEIEPFPIRVTAKRLPDMKHYGDINTLNGAELPPVDIITFGSPCTDLSVAGQRAGLDGEKSSLFFQAIRIVKEMRCKTDGKYPRFIVWENVLGAFSSGAGGDFRCVLDEIVKIKDSSASVPMPPKRKWLPAGQIMGDGFSVAYRTLDAQYWGVPQRRRRVFLVADFAGYSAGRVLFESESLPWHTPPCGGSRQAAPADAENGAGGAISFKPGAMSRIGGNTDRELTGTLLADMGDNQLCVAVENHPADSRVVLDDSGTMQTLTGRMGTGGGNVPMVMSERQLGLTVGEEVANTLIGTDYKGPQCVFEPRPMGIVSKGNGDCFMTEAHTSLTAGGGQAGQGYPCIIEPIAHCIQGNMIGRTDDNGPNGKGIADDVAYTLNTTDRHGVFYESGFAGYNEGTCGTLRRKGGTMSGGSESLITATHTVRRLTPLECSRLQGFPDDWCAGLETSDPTDAEIAWWAEIFETHRRIMGTSEKPKSRTQIVKWLRNPYSDSAAYKMWGNGVALPCVSYVLAGIANELRV